MMKSIRDIMNGSRIKVEVRFHVPTFIPIYVRIETNPEWKWTMLFYVWVMLAARFAFETYKHGWM